MKNPLLVALTDTHLNTDNIELNKSIYQQSIKIAKDLGLKKVYHKGDIFDSRLNQSLKTLLAFKTILSFFKEARMNLEAIPGNHDKVDYESDRSYLDVYSDHPNFVLHTSAYQDDLTKDIELFMIPYYKEKTVYSQKIREVVGLFDPNENHKRLLLTHCAATGVRNNDGSTMEEKETPPMECFRAFDKVFIGHYHNKQLLEQGQIVYPGSSFPHNYGEDNEKGLLLIYDDLSWELLDLEYPHYIKVEFDATKDNPQDIIDIKQSLKESDNFRVEVIGTSAETQAFDKTIFTKCGIEVKKKSSELEKNVAIVQQQSFESHTKASITKEFETFCTKSKIKSGDKVIGDKYINRLENVEF